MHHAPACPSESPPGAGNKTECDTWGMTRVEFSPQCRWTQWFIKKNEQVSRSAKARGAYLCAWGESGGGQETWSAEQSVGFHPYGQPVGWWASSRVSVIPSFTTHDRQIITHTQPECTLCEKADANDVGCVRVRSVGQVHQMSTFHSCGRCH